MDIRRRELLITPSVLLAAPAPARPRLYFSSAIVAGLKAKAAADAKFRQDWDKLLERARRLLDSELVPEDVAERGGGQHANYGQPSSQISSMGLALGLAYHMTGEKQFAEKLRRTMLAYAGYKRWFGQGLNDRVPPWHSELNTARFLYGYGAGYDAIHDFLTPADRKTIAGGMARLGILPTLNDWVLPETRIHALDSMGHNWWSVCVSMAGVAALALIGDDERAADWVDRISRGLALWFAYRGQVLQNKPANFDAAGAFYEGPGYTNYALSEYLRYRLAYSNVFPDRAQPRFAALERVTDYFIHSLYPTSSGYFTLNIGDSSLRQNSAATIRLLVETGFAHPLAGWVVKTAARQPSREGDPLEFLARKPMPAAASPGKHPTSVIYRDIGWAMLRDSWKPDATLLAVKSGFTWNHTHADAGSFVLFHQGVPLITDSGTCSYGDPAYTGYYVRSRAHNVILSNGEGQPAEDHRRAVKIPGQVHSLLDGLGLKYVYADATGPMAHFFRRNYRHWLWTGGAILIFDDVLAHEDGRLDWLLHYDGKAEAGGNLVRLTNGAGSAEVRFLFPTELTSREETGLADHEPSRKVPYLAFSAPTAARQQKFVVAIIPGGQAQAPSIEPLSARDALGVRLRHGGEITDVYLNLQADGRRMHENTNNIIEGWDTDAYLFAVTRPEASAEATPDNVTRAFVSSGSYLRKSGQVLLDSLSKVEAVWRPGTTTEVLIEGQDVIEASVRVAARPAALTANGKRATFEYSPRTKLVSFRVKRG